MRRARATIAIAAGAAATLLCVAQAEARCTRSGFRFGPGIEQTSTTWRVLAGTPCAAALSTRSLGLDRLAIDAPARHGVAGIASRYEFAYQPQSGFVGRDSFVVRIDFDHRGARQTTRLRVDVDVRNRL